MTPEEFRDAWFGLVSAPQEKVLRAVCDVYPDSLRKDDLAAIVGVSPSSGGYFNNLGRLRTLGAIEYPAPGSVRATETLFPESRQ